MSKLRQDAPHADVTYRIIGAAMQVHTELGAGHREAVYHRGLALRLPLPPFELSFDDEPRLPVYNSDGALVYTYCPDFVVEGQVIAELKAQAHPLTNDELAQVFDYFAASECRVALLINFGRPRLEWKRLFPPRQVQIRRAARS